MGLPFVAKYRHLARPALQVAESGAGRGVDHAASAQVRPSRVHLAAFSRPRSGERVSESPLNVA